MRQRRIWPGGLSSSRSRLIDLVGWCNAVDIGQREESSIDHEVEVVCVGAANRDGVDLMPSQAKVVD